MLRKRRIRNERYKIRVGVEDGVRKREVVIGDLNGVILGLEDLAKARV